MGHHGLLYHFIRDLDTRGVVVPRGQQLSK